MRLVAAVGAIAGTAIAARRPLPSRMDASLTRTFAVSRGELVDHLVGATTDLGSVFGIAGVTTALALGGERELALRTGAAGSVAWVVAQTAKSVLPRERPYQLGTAALLVSVPHGSSWPSGHSAVAAAMADTVAPNLRPAGRVGAWLSAAWVAASRLHVGAHHATDTVAGAALGILIGEGVRSVADALVPHRSDERPDPA